MSYRAMGQTVMAMATPQVQCLTQAQHDEALRMCKYQTVKGIGALPTGDPCALARLPICPPPVRATLAPTTAAATTTLTRASTATPSTTSITSVSPGLLAALQQKATEQVTPMAPLPVEPEKKMSVAVVGLLAVLALGGGYLVYRQVKKKPAMKQNRRRMRRNAGKRRSLPALSPQQRAALIAYADEKGSTWKRQLAADWMRAAARVHGPYDFRAELQQVRNQYGPAWLNKITLSELKEGR